MKGSLVHAISWFDKVRPLPVYLMAASVPVSTALSSISKLLILLMGAALLINGLLRHRREAVLSQLRTPLLIVLMLLSLALSLLYTTAPMGLALNDLAKYGKLLVIPLTLILLRNRREASTALGFYLCAQLFVIVSSWLLSFGLSLPWVPDGQRTSPGTVYSTYLDQSIMTAAFAAICWHLRHEFNGQVGARIAIFLAVLATINVLFLLPGRSGHLAMTAVVSLALFWAIPRRLQPLAVFLPVLLVGAAMLASPQFNMRLQAVVSESRAYDTNRDVTTSSGQRLSFWHRSLQAIAEKPFTGWGVGSWNQQYIRLEDGKPYVDTAKVRNPHQEFLMWGVQAGLLGMALMLGLLALLMRDSWRFAPATRHATHSIIAVLAVACLFNSALFDALIGNFFCILLGIFLALGLYAPPANALVNSPAENSPLPA